MGVIPPEVREAIARANVPDCSAGPMSLAKQDRRTLAAYVKTLIKSLATTKRRTRI